MSARPRPQNSRPTTGTQQPVFFIAPAVVVVVVAVIVIVVVAVAAETDGRGGSESPFDLRERKSFCFVLKKKFD